jgi:hypothetical protein
MNDKTFETYLTSELMNQIIAVAKDDTINFDNHSQVYYKLLQLQKHLDTYLEEYKLTLSSSFWYTNDKGSIDTIEYGAVKSLIDARLDEAEKDENYKLNPSDASVIGQFAKKSLFKYDSMLNPNTMDYSKLFEKFKYLTDYMGTSRSAASRGSISGYDSQLTSEIEAKDSSDE